MLLEIQGCIYKFMNDNKNRRYASYSLRERIVKCSNDTIQSMILSDSLTFSSQRAEWNQLLLVYPSDEINTI